MRRISRSGIAIRARSGHALAAPFGALPYRDDRCGAVSCPAKALGEWNRFPQGAAHRRHRNRPAPGIRDSSRMLDESLDYHYVSSISDQQIRIKMDDFELGFRAFGWLPWHDCFRECRMRPIVRLSTQPHSFDSGSPGNSTVRRAMREAIGFAAISFERACAGSGLQQFYRC